MLFSSILFIFYFFPISIIGYYLLKFSRKLQNIFLFIISLIFYSFGQIEILGLLIGSIVVNYIFGIIVDKNIRNNKKRSAKITLIIACVCNLGILFIFKYFIFLLQNVITLTGLNINLPNIVLPLGISFYTFQALCYVIDVYRCDAKVQKNVIYLGLYIAFFPQLIAGPIVRYNSIEEQIINRKESINKFSVGCCRFITGLAKKVVIANNMAIVADAVFMMVNNDSASVAVAWIGSIAYTFQIFFDFSAYSDMAIGLGLMFGFKFNENFNYPYISKSISEFWRRWHISLTTWFKDYVYFPLGGSRVDNKDKMVRNIFIVWILTGVWHGAGWTFILWGILNFVVIIIERLFRIDKGEVRHSILRHIYTLFFINLGWVLFRSESLSEATKFIGNMFGINSEGLFSDTAFMFISEYGVFFVLAIVFSIPVAKRCNKLILDKKLGIIGSIINCSYPFVIVTVFLICVAYLVTGSYNPFIYFNF